MMFLQLLHNTNLIVSQDEFKADQNYHVDFKISNSSIKESIFVSKDGEGMNLDEMMSVYLESRKHELHQQISMEQKKSSISHAIEGICQLSENEGIDKDKVIQEFKNMISQEYTELLIWDCYYQSIMHGTLHDMDGLPTKAITQFQDAQKIYRELKLLHDRGIWLDVKDDGVSLNSKSKKSLSGYEELPQEVKTVLASYVKLDFYVQQAVKVAIKQGLNFKNIDLENILHGCIYHTL